MGIRRKSPRALLFDLDGTLYRGEQMVPGADLLLRTMRERNVPCWFVTNNSTRTAEDVARHLVDMGIPAEAGQVITSSLAAADYISMNYPASLAYIVGESGLADALGNAGIRLLNEEDSLTAARPDLVVQGIDRAMGYSKIAEAVRHVLSGSIFIQTNPDRLLPVNGALQPGAGSIGAMITAATGIEPIVIGKPSTIIMDYTLGRAGVAAEEAWVIGDNPHTDLAAAANAGCPSVLVLTGLCSRDDWQSRCVAAGVAPDLVCEDLDELNAIIKDALNT
jgi:4-nitrophenyl phosphatase